MIGRKSTILGVTSFMLLALLFARPALATAEEGEKKLRFTIPFGFTVSSTRLPRGSYEVSTTLGGALRVQGSTKGAFAWPQGVTGDRDGRMRLIFYKHGREFVLSQVWMGGKDGHELMRPPSDSSGVRTARNGADDELEWVTVGAQ